MKVTHSVVAWDHWFAERRLIAAREELTRTTLEAEARNPGIILVVDRQLGAPESYKRTKTAKADREREINGLLAEVYRHFDRSNAEQGLAPINSQSAARIIVTAMGQHEVSRFAYYQGKELPVGQPARGFQLLLGLHTFRAGKAQRTPSERSIRRKLDGLRASGKIRR
ncbi:hypothetical protein KD146_17485 [Devosia sp. BSSL-BM10]|uniref:Uncharacterized protein n=1 Tax=Devosia litorisediminis TaxID=2829817 RepID=A0A942IFF6_9HYPH|nr:hypothetical protein [Devosia litorisediminis]MBS3850495.1 hypothetical protein [Devosia litorisediminis]